MLLVNEKRGYFMFDAISVKEAAEKWQISERRIQKFCESGRIEGVKRFGHSWMIPADVKKPCDLRKRRKAVTSEVEAAHEH